MRTDLGEHGGGAVRGADGDRRAHRVAHQKHRKRRTLLALALRALALARRRDDDVHARVDRVRDEQVKVLGSVRVRRGWLRGVSGLECGEWKHTLQPTSNRADERGVNQPTALLARRYHFPPQRLEEGGLTSMRPSGCGSPRRSRLSP